MRGWARATVDQERRAHVGSLSMTSASPRDLGPTRWTRGARGALVWIVAVASVAAVLGPGASADAQRRRRDRDRDRAAAAETPPAATEGAIMITGDYAGAEVLVDETSAGTMPLDPVRVAPGSHTIRIRLAGYSEYTDVVSVAAGDVTDVWVDMIPLSEVLAVETTPAGAHVFVDGTFLGDTPTEVELNDGERTLRLVLPGYEEVTRTVTAVAGTRDTLTLTLEALPADDGEQWYESPITWGAVGGGVAAVVIVIVIVAVATSSSGTQLDQFCAGGMQPCLRLDVAF